AVSACHPACAGCLHCVQNLSSACSKISGHDDLRHAIVGHIHNLQSNMITLRGRVIIVTGAGQGIGRSIAERAVEFGASVVAVDRNAPALETLAQALADAPLLTHVGSVSDPECAPAVLSRTLQRFGAVHGLVNNAGIVRAALIHKMSAAAWQEVI